ncbi:MAG TPA: hypothetical protein EYP69_05875 [Bacteroidales bacterium]|nr:hypothetical protein [Bacteroidales bacterium]
MDKLFENLKNFKASPPASAWNAVSEKVFLNNIASNLQRFTAKAGSYIWNDIAKKLLWYNFTHFSYTTFNIFYMAAALLMGLLTFIFISSENNLQTQQLTNKHTTKSASIQKITLTDNLDKNSTIQKKDILLPNNNIDKNSGLPLLSESKTKNNSHKENCDNKDKMVLTAMASLPPATSRIEEKNAHTLTTNISDMVIDTFRVFDTIYFYDTLFVIQENTIKLNEIEKGYSVKFYFASLSGKTDFTSEENPALADTNNSALSRAISISGGVDFEIGLAKHIHLQTGIGILNVNENFKYRQTKMNIDTIVKPFFHSNTFYNYFQSAAYDMDTTGAYPVITYTHYEDGTVTTDTTWFYQVDTNEVIVRDSVLTSETDTTYETVYDTTFQHYFYEYANKYTYLQIPFILGYDFVKGKLTYTVSGGIINEIFLNAKGHGISFKDAYEVVDIKKDFPFIKYNVSYFLGAGIAYKLDNNISVFAECFYQKNVNSIFRNDFVLKKRLLNYGLKTGLKIRF